jgi:8-oxo-dGTP pyrophosphatase MutT (NUDIX family)
MIMGTGTVARPHVFNTQIWRCVIKAIFTETLFIESENTEGQQKTVELPFGRVSARAIIVRRGDGAILGTLHRKDGSYALPGGGIEDNESTEDAIIRELKEENITLIDSDDDWRERITVDYFGGYKELTVWYLFTVTDTDVQPCEENIETRWISQNEDVWYPLMRDKILLAIQKHLPELSKS